MRTVLELDSLSLHETYLIQLTASVIITYCHYYFHSKVHLHRDVAILPIQCAVLTTQARNDGYFVPVRDDFK